MKLSQACSRLGRGGIVARVASGFVVAVVLAASARSAIGQAGVDTASSKHEKTLLLVTTTLGFRHAAVPLQEKLIREMAASTHEFRIISTSDSADYPAAAYQAVIDDRNAHISATDAQENDRPPFLSVFGGLPGATPAMEKAITEMIAAVAPSAKRETAARDALSAAIVSGEANEAALREKVNALADASRDLAQTRQAAMQKLQSSPQRLSPSQIRVVQQAAGGDFGTQAPPLAATKQARVNAVGGELSKVAAKDGEARAALTSTSYSGQASDLATKVEATRIADMEYAIEASRRFAELAHSDDRLSASEQAMVARVLGVRTSAPRGARSGSPEDANLARVTKILQEYLNPEALKNYDAVAFLSTTGELPLPDKDAFFHWIADGHGFVGLHSAADTLHRTPEYIKMLGGEFETHGMFHPKAQVLNVDPTSPLTAGWGHSLAVNEEFYLFKSFDPKSVHMLLELDEQPYTKAPGVIPVSWIKSYGKGRVFYTSLGHRDDVLFDAPIGDQEYKKRYNDPSVPKVVDQHILQGIRFALGLVNADTTPQSH